MGRNRVSLVLVAVLAVTALAGCAGAPIHHATEAAHDDSAMIPGAPSPTPVPSYSGPHDGAGLPHAPATAAEWDLYGQTLTSYAAQFQISNPPEVDVKAWVAPEDIANYANPCIEAQGYQLVGGSWQGISDATKPQFQLAEYTCFAAYPPQPRYIKPYTRKTLEIAYDWMVKTEIPCLKKHGYSISNVPSKEAWISTYYTNTFFPYSQLPDGANTPELNRDCPQWPPSSVLWGG